MTATMMMGTAASLALGLERARLRLHFARVDALLAGAPVPAGGRASARRRSLAQLRAYAREGRFPLHGGRGPRRPVFIDHSGTHCAMGHLLAINGHAPLALRIAREQNYALLPALAGTPGLLDAVRSLGLTAEEAALIQPAYDDRPGAAVELEPGPGPLGNLVFILAMALLFSSVLMGLALLVSTHLRHALLDRSPERALATLVFVFGGVLVGAVALLIAV